MRLQVWVHVFTAGWLEPLDDLIGAFNAADLSSASSTVRLGVVGPEVGRSAVVKHFETYCDLEPVVQVYAEHEGNEALTINAVRAWAQEHPGDAVLYCHTKGASRPLELNRRWRWAMIEALIPRWRYVLTQLDLPDLDAAGPFWVDLEVATKWPIIWGNNFFAGNFWMARNDYLAELPVCGEYPRSLGEEWIGLHGPRVLDLLPGFPDHAFFGLPEPDPSPQFPGFPS